MAEKRLSAAQEFAAQASAAHKVAIAELTQVKDQQAEIAKAERAALAALHHLLPSAVLAQNDAALLGPLEIKVKALEATRVDAAESALKMCEASLNADEIENADGLRVAREELARMPMFARPSPEATAEQLATTSELLDALLTQVRKDESALGAIRTKQQEARSVLLALQVRHEKEVAEPKRRCQSALIGLLG